MDERAAFQAQDQHLATIAKLTHPQVSVLFGAGSVPSQGGPKMQKYQSSRNVFQQTTALLWKNILQKWRMRVQSFQEGFSSVVLLIAIVLLTLWADLHTHEEIPEAFLGHLDDPSFNITGVKIAYTPDTMMARETMRKIETISVLQGIQTELMEDEKAMEAAQKEEHGIIGVVFQDDVSYRLRFSPFDVVSPSSLIEDIDLCYDFSSGYCSNPKYWFKGFVSLQSSIDSALIERITNHSVWDEMKSMSAIRMESPTFTPLNIFQNLPFYFAIPMCFSPIIYFLSQNVSQEKRKLKEVMKTMGLQDTAFWLSWGLLYAVFVLIISCELALALNYLYFVLSSFPALFLLFFLYGISSICFCFMISSVLKKPKSTCLVVFILNLFFGVFSIVTLMNLLPAALEWILSIFCPFAFGNGLSKVFRFQKYGKNFYLSELMHEPCLYVLLFDSALYILLTAYFDKVVPDKYGVPYPAFFFLKKSYWCKSRSTYSEDASGNEQGHGMIFSDKAESVPSEFDGKEVIRLNNIKKTYKVGKMETEALR
ncbi:ABC-type organic anion transporter ABCA8B-like, partial [Varanus komodoensis]|uniref:ABC-type organic anion transporter ABCA8B-like n=1 Tax=Varanus komodoensis TaxID=61221 RepID=UPI001CF7EA37